MRTEVLELETETVSNELSQIVETSGVEKTESEKLLAMFTPYFKKMGEVEKKIGLLNAENPGKEDVKIAREIRLALKNNRVAAEKVKDDAKADILIKGRLIDNLNNIVKNTSKSLELQCEKIEKDAEIKEAARIAALQAERAEQLAPFVEDATIFPLGTMTEEQYTTLLEGSKLAHQQKIEAAQKAEADRLAKEAADKLEQERIRQENERLKAEAEEKEKALAAERAENERKAKEEAEKQAAILKAEQEKAAKERAEAEAKIKAEREAAEKALREQKAAADKLAAELKAKEEAEKKAKAEAERKEAERIAAEKKAAAAPLRERMGSTVTALTLNLPESAVTTAIIEKFEGFKKWALSQIETL